MYHQIGSRIVGYCPSLDFQLIMENDTITLSEDLRDILPYLYEKHFGVPYSELGWYLEPGAREWVKEIEDKWFHNQLDLNELYKDREFIQNLVEQYYLLDEDDIDSIRDEFEMALESELEFLSSGELKELYEDGDSVYYEITDDAGNVIVSEWVDLPEIEDEDEEDDD